MATTTVPQHRTGAHRGRWLASGIALLVLAIIIALLMSTRQHSTAP